MAIDRTRSRRGAGTPRTSGPSHRSTPGIGDAGAVVDGDVHEVPAAASTSIVDFAAVDAPAAAVRHLAQLLDIDVQQLAGPVPFVADVGRSSADDLAGQSVDLARVRQLPAAQDRPDPGGRQLQEPGQCGWAGVLVQPGATIRSSTSSGVRRGLRCGL